MNAPILLHPAALFDRRPNSLRTLALGHFGRVAMALAGDHQPGLTEPKYLLPESIGEWRDAIAEEILLFAQNDRKQATELSGPFEDSHPFRHGPTLRELMALEAAVAVLPVDTSDSSEPDRQGAWMHLWLVYDPEQRLAQQDDRHRLEGVDDSSVDSQCKLYLVTTHHTRVQIAGRSWQLGASLAGRALRSEYKRQLAIDWIVTGEVDKNDPDKVVPICLGNKTNIPWFDTGRSWLLPDQNLAEAMTAARPRSEFRTIADHRCFGVRTVNEAADRVRCHRVTWVTRTDGSPFVGLGPYEARHQRVFFGRKEAIERCQRFLDDAVTKGCAFLLILGESGSGKSSLVRAGLAPQIAEPGDPGWVTAVFRPVGEPLAALTETVSTALRERGLGNTDWECDVARDPAGAAASVAEALGPAIRLLLVVDQLEDAFHTAGNHLSTEPCKQPGAQVGEPKVSAAIDPFAKALFALARSGGVWVVATLRADQVAELSKCEALFRLTKDGASYYVLPPDFNEIIRRPLEAAGLFYQKRENGSGDLGDVLLEDVRKAGSDALPLLQMTLDQLFKARDEKRQMLTFAAYEAIGRLEGAIARHADGLLRELNEVSRKELGPLLLALAGWNSDGSLLLRRISRKDCETLPARRSVVDKLLSARLLVVNDKGELRLTHEALLREWKAAAETLRNYRAAIELRDDLRNDVLQWLAKKKGGTEDIREFLLHGARLKQAQIVLDQLEEMLPETANLVAYIKASADQEASDLSTNEVRLAKARENLAHHLAELDFTSAAAELDNVVLNSRQEIRDVRRSKERIERLAQFYTAARQAETLAGEEDFSGALKNCEGALKALKEDEDILRTYRTLAPFGAQTDAEGLQVKQLEQTAYRVRLLFCALQLVAGIKILFCRHAPEASRPKRVSGLRHFARFVPLRLLLLFFKAGGASLLRLPERQGEQNALAEFKKCSDELALVQEVEKQRAEDKGEKYRPSRTSCLVGKLAAVLSEFAAKEEGDKIDFRQWLSVEAPAKLLEPVNAVDYFFIGLFNYFIAKRSDGLLAKMLSLVHGVFLDLDARTPLATAERLLRFAVNLDRDNFWCHWLLGRTLLAAKNYRAAELAFNAAIAVKPSYARGWEQLALALGHQWVQTKDDRVRIRAEEASAKALRDAEGDPSIFWPRGELFQLLGKIGEAVDAYSRWLELEENIPDLISRSTGVQTLYNSAGDLLSKAKSDGERADAYALLALVYMTWAGWEGASPVSRNLSQALRAAEAALKLNPNHAHARTVEGVVLRRKDRVKEAAASLKLALDQDPLAYRAALNLALVLDDAGQEEEALAVWADLRSRSDKVKASNEAKASVKGKQFHETCPRWMLGVIASRGRHQPKSHAEGA